MAGISLFGFRLDQRYLDRYRSVFASPQDGGYWRINDFAQALQRHVGVPVVRCLIHQAAVSLDVWYVIVDPSRLAFPCGEMSGSQTAQINAVAN